MYLVGDIGGTNARFALADVDAVPITLHHSTRFPVSDHPTLESALWAYLDSVNQPKLAGACLAWAGPVTAGVARLTNASWIADTAALKTQFGFARISLVNDFIGQALGAALTPPATRVELLPGLGEPDAPVAVLGPGTGLGLAYVTQTPSGPRVLSTEGGHAAFAPRDALDELVLHAVQKTMPYVSFEAIISGPGLERIDNALRAHSGDHSGPRSAKDIVASLPQDTNAQLAVHVFCAALGTFAGDAVLIGGARGGVFLSGGILPRIQNALLESGFAQRFRERGPMSDYVAATPVTLIKSPDVALLGAAALCRTQHN